MIGPFDDLSLGGGSPAEVTGGDTSRTRETRTGDTARPVHSRRAGPIPARRPKIGRSTFGCANTWRISGDGEANGAFSSFFRSRQIRGSTSSAGAADRKLRNCYGPVNTAACAELTSYQWRVVLGRHWLDQSDADLVDAALRSLQQQPTVSQHSGHGRERRDGPIIVTRGFT